MRWLLLLFVAQAFAGSGEYHVCTDADGKKTFTSAPCPAGTNSEVKEYRVKSGAELQPRGDLLDSKAYQAVRDSNRRSELGREVRRSERKLEALQDAMDNELQHLRRKKLRATNSRAGAEWESSISAEMQAVTERYRNKLNVERDRLRRLQDELAAL